MCALVELRRFILAKCSPEEQHEIRGYIAEHLQVLASAFHVPPETITTALDAVKDDSSFAVRMLETIRRTGALHRERRRANRARKAQACAEIIGAEAQWDGEKMSVDILALLSLALTCRRDLLIFSGEGFSVGVYQSALFDLAKLKKKDLTAFVNGDGLQIRWSSGGLNLRPQSDPKAASVVVALPVASVVVAA